MIPACFSNPNSPSSEDSTAPPMPQNLITCTYQTHLCNSPTQLTLTWSKTLFSHTLTLFPSDNSFSVTISLSPSTFSFFRTSRAGSKSINLTHQQKIKLHWDFTRAEFNRSSAEPDSSFYIAITFNSKLEFFLGDLQDELTRRVGVSGPQCYSAESTLLSRREHVFGRRTYVTRAQFMRSKHEIEIDCTGGVLKVKVNGVTSLVVKRLAWKFRGKERIMISGVEVEFYWDVFNWVNNSSGNSKSGAGHGVFVFQIGEGGGIWPEMVGPEKKLMRKSFSGASGVAMVQPPSPSPSSSSVLQWAEESSHEGCRSSCSSCTKSCGSNGGGFSLLLYAWRKE